LKFSLISVFSDIQNKINGNVAAVVMLDHPIEEDTMASLASHLNQPATTFLWKKEENSYNVRWFAPDAEIGLCGHGTMAATAYLSEGKESQHYKFYYRNGRIDGRTDKDGLCFIELDAIPLEEPQEVPDILKQGLGIEIKEFYKTSNKYLVVAESEEAVKNMQPDFGMLRKSKVFGYAVTAQGNSVDFVSRTLVPHVQQLEDHATGSSHAFLVPFWASRLGKENLEAIQLSKRGGRFQCELKENTVVLSGDYAIIGNGVLNPEILSGR
jgi:PhzF family phenazine biosynthesis protein